MGEGVLEAPSCWGTQEAQGESRHRHTEVTLAEGESLGKSHASAEKMTYYQPHVIKLYENSQFLQDVFNTLSKSHKTFSNQQQLTL